MSIGGVIVRPSPDLPSRAVLVHWADREMQAQKRAQIAGRARMGAKFSPYGTTPISPARMSDDDPSSWRSRLPRGRSDVLELGAFVAAGAVLVATAVVLGIRLLR